MHWENCSLISVCYISQDVIGKSFPLRQILSLGCVRLYFTCALPIYGLLVYISFPNKQISGYENITILRICSNWHRCSLEPPSRKALHAWPPGTPTKLHVQDPNLWMLQSSSINVKKMSLVLFINFWGTQILGKVSLGQWNNNRKIPKK